MDCSIKKIKLHIGKGFLLGFFLLFVMVFSYSQTKDDVSILRQEILNKMQANNHNVEDLIKYYSGISLYDSQILNIKRLLIEGEYENALNKIFLLQKTAEDNKQSENYFQYLCVYGEVCRSLGLTSELTQIGNQLKGSPYLRESTFTDLALGYKSFDIFPLRQRIEILKSSIEKYKRNNDVYSMIQASVWLAEILKNTNPNAFNSVLNNALSALGHSETEIYYHILADNFRAKILYEKKEAKISFELLEKYQKSIGTISNTDLKKDFFENLARSSALTGNFEKLQSANTAFMQAVENDMSKKSAARAILVNHISQMNNEKLEAQTLFFRKIYIGIAILFIIGLISIYFSYKKKLQIKI